MVEGAKIDALYTTGEYQVDCDVIRMRFIDGEPLDATYERARRLVARKTDGRGKLSGLGV